MKPLKVIFERLNIEVTTEYLDDFDSDIDINEIKFNKKWQFSSHWFDYFKEKDSDIIKASCNLEGTDRIGELQEAVNYLKEMSGYDNLFIIVKDRYDGDEDEEYITFDAEFTSYPSPPGIIWRGVEKKYGIITDKEDKKFQKIRDSLCWDAKYTESYIAGGNNYNPEKWTKLWIEENLK